MPSVSKMSCVKIVIDVILLFTVTICIGLVRKLWPRTDSGMFCNDTSMNYPYIKEDTVSDLVLISYGIGMTIIIMCIVELRLRKSSNENEKISKKLASSFPSLYSSISVFLFGCAYTVLLTDIAKYSIGALRPNFVEICKPDVTDTICTKLSDRYISTIVCTTDDMESLSEARLSFPSGHASFSAYTMIYLIIYLQAKFHIDGLVFIRPIIQMGAFFLTFYTCISRISDFKHFWIDVIAGFLLGTVIALFTSLLISDIFKPKRISGKKEQVLFLQDHYTTEERNALSHITNH